MIVESTHSENMNNESHLLMITINKKLNFHYLSSSIILIRTQSASGTLQIGNKYSIWLASRASLSDIPPLILDCCYLWGVHCSAFCQMRPLFFLCQMPKRIFSGIFRLCGYSAKMASTTRKKTEERYQFPVAEASQRCRFYSSMLF